MPYVYRFRPCPNKKQEELFNKQVRQCRAALNSLKEGFTRLKRVVGVDCSKLIPVEGMLVPCEEVRKPQ
ncbi:hypothetical protein BCF55_1240 [Hydrogenivirga caldilitoris]|uniref:Helix-turn-helix protein n=1 Tax=Hydrogenivirga caldilitoris TaxID=246264 RepID=A0A497XRP3_9AQUI|nr:hypothetical protein [Hydrogenivirga caldilitoris]RLJ70951.1 hypothetical protein BCF55_1240 [Hydrogenivirga caldilitoris]